jgi:hypothetical protein
MRAAFGSGSTSDFSDASLTRLKDTYKMVEGHFVSPNLEPYADLAARLHAHGMKAIYNVEMAVWVNPGMNINYDISGQRPKLAAIKAAGWDGFVCEGISQKQVSVLQEYLPFYNEGGEGGEDVYANGSMYYRPRSMAGGNYNECYHKSVNYTPAFLSANQSTPNNMGMTFMLYTTASLEMDTPALISYIDSVIAKGVKINTLLFWVGVVHSALTKLDGEFNFLWRDLNNKYKFSVGGISTNMNFKANKVNPIIGETVTFTATLMTGTTPLGSKSVKIYHTLGGVRVDDATVLTNASGVATFSYKFTAGGAYQYFATFGGDTTYSASSSPALAINVTKEPTPFPATSGPALCSRRDAVGSGVIETFVRGADSALWYKNGDGKWASLGGLIYDGMSPAVCSMNPNRLDAFVIGTNKAVYYKTNNNGTWNEWKSLQGICTASPAVISSGDGHMQVSVRGSENTLWKRVTKDGGTTWTAWAQI